MNFEKSSGCVFKDLGVDKPEVIMTREEIEGFEEWFTVFKRDNYLHETDWGLEGCAKSIARICAEGAYKHLLTENKRLELQLSGKTQVDIQEATARKCAEIAETLKPDRFGKLERFQVADEIKSHYGLEEK